MNKSFHQEIFSGISSVVNWYKLHASKPFVWSPAIFPCRDTDRSSVQPWQKPVQLQPGLILDGLLKIFNQLSTQPVPFPVLASPFSLLSGLKLNATSSKRSLNLQQGSHYYFLCQDTLFIATIKNTLDLFLFYYNMYPPVGVMAISFTLVNFMTTTE